MNPTSRRRRIAIALLALGGVVVGSGCGTPAGGGGELIIEVASGRRVDRDQLLRALARSDYVLLGELHDNPAHHARRGELIEALQPAAVVAEQLNAGAVVRFGADLLASLSEAGFDAKAWGWPMHQPVFAAAAVAGVPVLGGNLSRERARSVAREGEAAWTMPQRELLQRAPLGDGARELLDADLVRGHCGQLSAERLPGIRAAQRARDATMAQAMVEASSRPVVLVAGNGHVRLDYGVGQLLARLEPGARTTSVGFVEPDQAMPRGQPYTYLWVTAKAERKDPCAGFSAPSMR